MLLLQQDDEEADETAEKEANLVNGKHLNGYRSPRDGDGEEDDMVYFINAILPDDHGIDSEVRDSLIYSVNNGQQTAS